MARDSYIHPAILDADRETLQAIWSSSRSSKWLDRYESAVIKLLRNQSNGN